MMVICGFNWYEYIPIKIFPDIDTDWLSIFNAQGLGRKFRMGNFGEKGTR
jgi:hypothetical protein